MPGLQSDHTKSLEKSITMVLIHRNNVPPYLHDSVFYRLLDPSDEEEFEVPEECFKRDLSFTGLGDLRHYLHTFQFWGSKRLDDRAFFYMYRNCGLDVIEFLQKEFYQIEVFTLVLRLRKSHPGAFNFHCISVRRNAYIRCLATRSSLYGFQRV